MFVARFEQKEACQMMWQRDLMKPMTQVDIDGVPSIKNTQARNDSNERFETEHAEEELFRVEACIADAAIHDDSQCYTIRFRYEESACEGCFLEGIWEFPPGFMHGVLFEQLAVRPIPFLVISARAQVIDCEAFLLSDRECREALSTPYRCGHFGFISFQKNALRMVIWKSEAHSSCDACVCVPDQFAQVQPCNQRGIDVIDAPDNWRVRFTVR